MGTRKDIDDLIGQGVQFQSYNQLHAALQRLMKRGHHFRIASSEVLRNTDGTQEQKYRYRSVVYHCVHYGAPRIRGNGSRQVSHLATGCQSFIRVTYNYRHQILEVTKSSLVHQGHKLETKKVGRPRYKKRAIQQKIPKKQQQMLNHQAKLRQKEMQTTMEEELKQQTEHVNSLWEKQKDNYRKYSKKRATLGLDPLVFVPPSLDVSTLLYFYTLEEKPYISNTVVKEEEELDDDEEEEEDVKDDGMKALDSAKGSSVTPPMFTDGEEENEGGFAELNVCGVNSPFDHDGSGDHDSHADSASTVEVEVDNRMDQSLYNEDFFSLAEDVFTPVSNA